MTVQDVYHWIDLFAPFASQEGFDNAGLHCLLYTSLLLH